MIFFQQYHLLNLNPCHACRASQSSSLSALAWRESRLILSHLELPEAEHQVDHHTRHERETQHGRAIAAVVVDRPAALRLRSLAMRYVYMPPE
jgi:hypothetical protein